MLWFDGSVTAAITAAKQRNALFVVYVRGDDDISAQMDATWEDGDVSRLCQESGMVAIKFNAKSEECKQFSQFYPVMCVPCVSFISGETGIPLEGTAGHLSPADFQQRIQKVLEVSKQGSSVSTSQATDGISGPPPPVATSPPPVPQPSSAVPPQAPQQSTTSQTPQEPKKELSKLEKAARLRQKMEEIHQRKEAQKEEEIKKKEIDRRKVGQSVQQSMKDRAEQEAKRVAEDLRKEKEEDRLAKERVRQQIARDRAEKQSRYSADKKEREKAQAAAKETAAQAATEPPKRKINMSKDKPHRKNRKHWWNKQMKFAKLVCPQCTKEYNNTGSLSRHVRIEHGPRVFNWCRRCEFKCKRRDNLGRHYRQHHADHLTDLDVIASETIDQWERRVWLENAARGVVSIKPKGSQKRKTGRKTYLAFRKNPSKQLKPSTSFGVVNGDDCGPNSGIALQHTLPNSMERIADGTRGGEDALASVKVEVPDVWETPRRSPCPDAQNVVNSRTAIGPISDYAKDGVYHCPKCVMTYQQSSSLRRHILSYHGPEVFFWCRHCTFGSKRKDNLRRHYRQMHSEHMDCLDSISYETIEEKEKREQRLKEAGFGAGYRQELQQPGQQQTEFVQPVEGNYLQFEIPETWSHMPEMSSSSPVGFEIEPVQTAEMIPGNEGSCFPEVSASSDDVASPGMPLFREELEESSTEMVWKARASTSNDSTIDSGLTPKFKQPALNQQMLDSNESTNDFLLICPSEPVMDSDIAQDCVQWQTQAELEDIACPPVDTLKCPKCSNRYRHQGSLSRHLKINHSSQHFFWCRRCDFRTPRKNNLERHYGVSHRKQVGEVNTIRLETIEQKHCREREDGKLVSRSDRGWEDAQHVQDEEGPLSLTSMGLLQGSEKAAPDAGHREHYAQPEEAESIVSSARSTEKSKRRQGRAGPSHAAASTDLVLTPRVELVKMVIPLQEPPAGQAGAPVKTRRPKTSLKRKQTHSLVHTVSGPSMSPTTLQAVKDLNKEPIAQKRLTRSIGPDSNSAQRDVMPTTTPNLPKSQQRHATCSVVNESLNAPNSPGSEISQDVTTDQQSLDTPERNDNQEASISGRSSRGTHPVTQGSLHLQPESPTGDQGRNSKHSEQRHVNTDSPNSLQLNATRTDPESASPRQGLAANNSAPEQVRVTSTSEGPSISLTRLEQVLRGNVTRVVEESHTVIYHDGTKVKESTVKRTYEVMFQADFGNGTVNPVTE